MTDPLQWSPQDGARAWSQMAAELRPEIVEDTTAFALFGVGSSALLAYQRAVDDLSDQWLARAEKLEASGNIHLREEAGHLRALAREMRTKISGARLPHVPRGQRAPADEELGDD